MQVTRIMFHKQQILRIENGCSTRSSSVAPLYITFYAQLHERSFLIDVYTTPKVVTNYDQHVIILILPNIMCTFVLFDKSDIPMA